MGILFKQSLKIKLLSYPVPHHLNIWYVTSPLAKRLSALSSFIDTTPSSKVNKSTPAFFLTEFYTLLERLLTYPGHLIIAGDFNFHVDVADDPNATKLLDTLDSGRIWLVAFAK